MCVVGLVQDTRRARLIDDFEKIISFAIFVVLVFVATDCELIAPPLRADAVK